MKRRSLGASGRQAASGSLDVGASGATQPGHGLRLWAENLLGGPAASGGRERSNLDIDSVERSTRLKNEYKR